jgi:hypothetical protein
MRCSQKQAAGKNHKQDEEEQRIDCEFEYFAEIHLSCFGILSWCLTAERRTSSMSEECQLDH